MIERRVVPGLVVLCLVLTSQSRLARAGACPSPQVRVFPDPTVMAPTNVRLRLVFEAEEVTVHELLDPTTRQIVKTGHVKASAVRVSLRDSHGREAKVTLHRPPATRNPILYVKPNVTLSPGTRYAVVLKSGADEYIISHLRTGTGPATAPPAIGRVELAIFSAHPRPRHWKDARGRYALITLSAVTSGTGGTNETSVRRSSNVSSATAYEIHELDRAGRASDATLRAVVPFGARGKVILRLAEAGACHEANFRFPSVARGSRSHPLRLGIRAVDDAGNASPLSEVVLDLARPGRYLRPNSPGPR